MRTPLVPESTISLICYGRGFTLYGLLPDDSNVDRTDIRKKIKNRYFDFIIYGSVHRDRSFLNKVRSIYPPSKIIFIDGEDGPGTASVLGQGIYFKRELVDADALPIQFAIPKEKIIPEIPMKTRQMSPHAPWEIPPGPRYEKEADYYGYGDYCQQPGRRPVGIVCAIMKLWRREPYPTLSDWRNALLERWNFFQKANCSLPGRCTIVGLLKKLGWQELMSKVRTVLKEKLTTEALAKHLLERIAS